MLSEKFKTKLNQVQSENVKRAISDFDKYSQQIWDAIDGVIGGHSFDGANNVLDGLKKNSFEHLHAGNMKSYFTDMADEILALFENIELTEPMKVALNRTIRKYVMLELCALSAVLYDDYVVYDLDFEPVVKAFVEDLSGCIENNTPFIFDQSKAFESAILPSLKKAV